MRGMSPTPRREKYKNEPEEAFARWAESQGWSVTKRAWPDFFCWKNGEFMCVEVKPGPECGLKIDQFFVLRTLAAAGVACYAWSPSGDGLVPVPSSGLPAEVLGRGGGRKEARRKPGEPGGVQA